MRIGRHMPTHSKMAKAAQIAQQIGCETIQIFVSNPTGWRPPADNDENCAAFAQAVHACQLDPVVIHAPYLINLGTTDDTIWHKSVSLLTWTMQRGARLTAKYVVFHTGSHRGAGVTVGLARVAQGIEKILRESPPEVTLLLENDVGAGNSLGHSLEQLAAILMQLPHYQDRLGICLDTAHLWGAGYDISSGDATRRMLQNCEETFGLACLKVIHLNDTAMALGSHRDAHKRLGEGIIGSEGLQTLLRDPRLDHTTVLMETPIKTDEHNKEDWTDDMSQILKAKALMGR
jgi:deoxyribonuclease-4